MSGKHPPVANRVVCVDLDGTIIPWGPLMGVKEPFPGVPEAMRLLRDRGYRIVILTSRMSYTWWEAEVERRGVKLWDFADDQLAYVQAILRLNDIPFDEITAEKVPAEAYFDDKAVSITTRNPLDKAILKFLGAA